MQSQLLPTSLLVMPCATHCPRADMQAPLGQESQKRVQTRVPVARQQLAMDASAAPVCMLPGHAWLTNSIIWLHAACRLFVIC